VFLRYAINNSFISRYNCVYNAMSMQGQLDFLVDIKRAIEGA
jgi:hypothetical protein